MDSKIVVEPWNADPSMVHVYTNPVWSDLRAGCMACVIHDLTLEEVREIIALAKWGKDSVAANCEVLRDICRDIVSQKRQHSVNKVQIGTFGFPVKLVNELTPIEVSWLHVTAKQFRIHQASYAINPFIDPIKFDSDELWLQVAEFFEAKFPGEYQRED